MDKTELKFQRKERRKRIGLIKNNKITRRQNEEIRGEEEGND